MQLSQQDKLILDEVKRFTDDPLGFVYWAYPWGKDGILKNETGPDEWQIRILKDLGFILKNGYVVNNGLKKDCSAGINIAVRSGHGIGKSSLMAWLDQWFMSTHFSPQIVTTANTEVQLKTKTWREQAKWHNLLIHKHWFNWSATRYTCVFAPETWFSSAIPWSESRPASFAGTHEKYVLIKFDEASEIPSIIWETVEGALTDSEGLKIRIVFGNPTQPLGNFIDCFEKKSKRWVTYEVDSRTSKRVKPELIKIWLEDYGEDSDFFRVRVKGQKPKAGIDQFVPTYLVEEAIERKVHVSAFEKSVKIVGVDIARGGADKTVIAKRQGIAVFPLLKYNLDNEIEIAEKILIVIKEFKPDMVFIDLGNNGGAVLNILKQWKYGKLLTGVWFGGASSDPACYNKRTQMWWDMVKWLREGGCLPPDDVELRDELIAPERCYRGDLMWLEPKKAMKSRGAPSPDCGDGIALTFAYPVMGTQEKEVLVRQNARYEKPYDSYALNSWLDE